MQTGDLGRKSQEYFNLKNIYNFNLKNYIIFKSFLRFHNFNLLVILLITIPLLKLFHN